MNIVNIIQNAVDVIVDKKYKDDPCKPVFIVSYYYDDKSKLLLTIRHNDAAVTKVIFPIGMRTECDLETEMLSLYNATM